MEIVYGIHLLLRFPVSACNPQTSKYPGVRSNVLNKVQVRPSFIENSVSDMFVDDTSSQQYGTPLINSISYRWFDYVCLMLLLNIAYMEAVY